MRPGAGTTVAAFAALAAALGTLGGSSGSPSHSTRWDHFHGEVDLLASAHPGPAEPGVRDSAFDVASTHRWDVNVDTGATSSATCAGCAADSDALQVVYVSRPREVVADNAAVAWSTQCESCSATALSVQVLVIGGGHDVTVNNRALAANAGCADCTTASAAYQLVVVADRAERLTHDELDALREWVAEQSAALRGAPAPALGSLLAAPQDERRADDLETLVNGALDSRTVELDIDTRVG